MNFYLNGQKVSYQGDSNLTLLKYLRQMEGIITPKDGCNCQGSCGACTVEIDGRPKLACLIKMSEMKGKHVITTDGFEQKIQDAFAMAFVEKGGIQCGFCIPGIVVTAKTLLKNNPNPTEKEVIKAINHHICRCSGYQKIVESILYAARILRGEDVQPPTKQSGHIGTSLMKYDSYDAVLGMKKFVGDHYFEGMHWAALKFSDHPKAVVKKIDISAAKKIKGVIKIITAKDIPSERFIGEAGERPMMVAEGETTRFVGDVLAGVVAISEEVARQALKKITVTYKQLKPVTTVDQAKRAQVVVQPSMKDNLMAEFCFQKGDTVSAFKDAKYISQGTYYSQRVEPAYLEKECTIVIPKQVGITEELHLDILSQGDAIYSDRAEISKMLGISHDRVNVISFPVGGSFLGRFELATQHYAALFSYVTKLPIRLELNREESIRVHPKRHPMRVKIKLGCDDKGILLALAAKIESDGGAYSASSREVIKRACEHVAGAYQILNVKASGASYYTNNIPSGMLRGAGVAQVNFALEGCLDDLCRQGGFDPWEFRYQNVLDIGKQNSQGEIVTAGIGLKKALESVKEIYQSAPYAGIALGMISESANDSDAVARAKVIVESADHIVICHGVTESGQGIHTQLIQTVAQITGISPDIIEVRVETHDDVECNLEHLSIGTTRIMLALQDACRQMQADLKHQTLSELQGKVYKGDSKITSPINSYGCQVVTLNQSGKIEHIYVVNDIGRVVNPVMFEGQTMGQVHMALGQVLSEKIECKNGFPTTFNLGKLGQIMAKSTPKISVEAIESNDPLGPFGAKEITEIGLIPTQAAVAGALMQFDGKKRTSLPLGKRTNKR